jgi:hypothetical protein
MFSIILPLSLTVPEQLDAFAMLFAASAGVIVAVKVPSSLI